MPGQRRKIAMCLAVPVEVVGIRDNIATCRILPGSITIQASTMLLSNLPVLGEFLIVHAGFAIGVLDREQARESLRQLQQAADGLPLAE